MTVGEAIKEAIKHAEGVMDENLEMTKEEAIEILKIEREYYCDLKECKEQQAFNMAIKALEQEPILDKIRAEIEKLEYLNIADGSDGYDKYIEQYEVLKIIDKYKAESEVKE